MGGCRRSGRRRGITGQVQVGSAVAFVGSLWFPRAVSGPRALARIGQTDPLSMPSLPCAASGICEPVETVGREYSSGLTPYGRGSTSDRGARPQLQEGNPHRNRSNVLPIRYWRIPGHCPCPRVASWVLPEIACTFRGEMGEHDRFVPAQTFPLRPMRSRAS